MAEQTVTVQPGESKTVSFEVTPNVAKNYLVSVNGLSGSFDAKELGFVVKDITILRVDGKSFIEVGTDSYGNPLGILIEPRRVEINEGVAPFNLKWKVDTTPNATNRLLTYELLPQQPAKFIFTLSFYDSEGVNRGENYSGETSWFHGINQIINGETIIGPMYGNPPFTLNYPGEGPGIYDAKLEIRIRRGGDLQWNAGYAVAMINNIIEVYAEG